MIFITGAGRSGTSLTTGVLRACGLNLGETNHLNEHPAVRDGLVKPVLKQMGCDPLGQHPLPDVARVRTDPEWREKVTKALGDLPEPWGFKDAKTCLLWPLWADAFPDATYVIVRRNRDAIANSCVRTGFMKRHKTRAGWEGWADHYIARLEEMKTHLRCIEVWPGTQPETFRPMIEACGLTWGRKVVEGVINPNKWHAA